MPAIAQIAGYGRNLLLPAISGLTLWQRTRCFQFRGRPLTVEDADGVAEIRMTD